MDLQAFIERPEWKAFSKAFNEMSFPADIAFVKDMNPPPAEMLLQSAA